MNNEFANLENILEINEIKLSGCGTKRTQQTKIVTLKKENIEKSKNNNSIFEKDTVEKSA